MMQIANNISESLPNVSGFYAELHDLVR